MFWTTRAQTREALAAARRASLQLGATIYTALRSDDLDVHEYMILSSEEFQALRMFCIDERPDTRLDCIWAIEQGAEVYYVRMDWDIRQITEIS